MAYKGPSREVVNQGIYCHEHWSPIGYPLLSTIYYYNVHQTFVSALLTETYEAQTNIAREVSYLFQVPPEASVCRFSATLGNTKVEAIIEEKSRAKTIYTDAVKANQKAWLLEQVNTEVFQISLGKVQPNDKIIIKITYVHHISSDSLQDSLRLTIPSGYTNRPGAAPAQETTAPTASKSGPAVTIRVSIDQGDQHILGLTCLSNHYPSIMPGFADDSYRRLSPVEQSRMYNRGLAYVELMSDTFLSTHFILTWNVPYIDQPRCLVEKAGDTLAFALTFVSNVRLAAAAHEYIFLLDCSGSMSGTLMQTAREAISTMLDNLPTINSSFNIYYFNTRAWSINPGERSLPYDNNTLAEAKRNLTTSVASGGTDINGALSTVIAQRSADVERSTVILVTDGLDWSVTAAMNTVTTAANTAAEKSNLFRVFVLGIGDTVSRGMCEGLARAGMGATAYIGSSQLNDRDNTIQKSKILIDSISRAPIRVKAIDWNVKLTQAPSGGNTGTGQWEGSRPSTDSSQLGAASKGSNLDPPPGIQQAPKPGTMFWAMRSHWYAIVRGNLKRPTNPEVKVTYDIPGVSNSQQQRIVKAQNATKPPETVPLVHTLAAHALIQTFEDQATSKANDPRATYINEAEIVRLGKTYNLASSQTSFIATMNGVGISSAATIADPGRPENAANILAGVPKNMDLNIPTLQSSHSGPQASSHIQRRSATMASSSYMFTTSSMPEIGDATDPQDLEDFDEIEADVGSQDDDSDALPSLLSAQDATNGSFPVSSVEMYAFPSTGLPAAPPFLKALPGHRDAVISSIWAAILATAWMQKKYPQRGMDWEKARNKALDFAKTHLCCVFGLGKEKAEEIVGRALEEAEGYVDTD